MQQITRAEHERTDAIIRIHTREITAMLEGYIEQVGHNETLEMLAEALTNLDRRGELDAKFVWMFLTFYLKKRRARLAEMAETVGMVGG